MSKLLDTLIALMLKALYYGCFAGTAICLFCALVADWQYGFVGKFRWGIAGFLIGALFFSLNLWRAKRRMRTVRSLFNVN